MPMVRVVKRCKLTHDPVLLTPRSEDEHGNITHEVWSEPKVTIYEPGTYDVTDEIANHWYFLAHTDAYVAKEPPKIGAAAVEFAQRALSVEQAARNNEPVADSPQAPAPDAPGVEIAKPLPTNNFAGGPVQDVQPNRVNFLA